MMTEQMAGLPDFKIERAGKLSITCLANGINNFMQLCSFIYKLPYGRNANKDDLATVFDEKCGTCGTKNALLKQVADEQGQQGFALITGFYRMNGRNTPKTRKVLEQHGLDYIPEAHNYLKYNSKIHDLTGEGFDPVNYEADLLKEVEIMPSQISAFKVALHKNFLNDWLAANPGIGMTLEELWIAREACIHALSTE